MTDLARICAVVRKGGIECEPSTCDPRRLSIFHVDKRFGEQVLAADAVTRPEVLRAFEEAWFAAGAGYRHVPYIIGDILRSKDRIAWVIENIVEPIEKALEEKKRGEHGYI